jgi:hypothetical protein
MPEPIMEFYSLAFASKSAVQQAMTAIVGPSNMAEKVRSLADSDRAVFLSLTPLVDGPPVLYASRGGVKLARELHISFEVSAETIKKADLPPGVDLLFGDQGDLP